MWILLPSHHVAILVQKVFLVDINVHQHAMLEIAQIQKSALRKQKSTVLVAG